MNENNLHEQLRQIIADCTERHGAAKAFDLVEAIREAVNRPAEK